MAEKKTASKKTAAKKTPAKKAASGKRELIAPNGDKRYARREADGKFKESVEVGKSLSQDVKKKAKTTAKAGEGDRGDEKKSKSSKK